MFLLLVSLFRLAVGAGFELTMDEAYYWEWSRHLSLSYYDHPPMVALVLALTTFFSDSEIFIRLAAVLGAVASSLVIYRFCVELYGSEKAGLRAVLIANVTLIFTAGALVPTPDTPLIPFYIAGILAFLLALRSDPSRPDSYTRWVVAGAFIGCALLSKYTAFFFFPCAFLYMLFSEKRFWFFKPHPWLAFLVSFIFFSPVLIWNANHHWVSLSFQAGHGMAEAGGNPLSLFGEFLGFQVILYSIGIFFFLIAALVSLTRKSFDRSDSARESSLFLFSFSAPILLFFALNAFRARMEGNWPILGFIPLFIYAGQLSEQWDAGGAVRKMWRGSIALAVLLFAFLHLQLVNPVIPHPQRYEISRRVYGWKLLAGKIDAVRRDINATFLIANRHQLTGLMTYYTKPHMLAYVLDLNAQRYFFLPPPDSQKGKNGIYLVEEERDMINRIKPMFDRVEKAETVVITRKGELIRRFVIYKCYNYRGGLS
jgi:undecaprenyl-diphosphatase